MFFKPNLKRAANTDQPAEPQSGRPSESGEAWLGRNRTDKRRLWERLNPRHRKELRMLAEALALQQTHARLQDNQRARLNAALTELDRVIRRVAAVLADISRGR